MAPIIEVSDDDLKAFNQLGLKYKMRSDLTAAPKPTSKPQVLDFIHVPSINLDVSVQKVAPGESWDYAHKVANNYGGRMLNPLEFNRFLNYVKTNKPDIYAEITQVRSPWRAEWLNAQFELKDKVWHINYNDISELLDENTLIEDRLPGISIEDWLENPTSQGLPRKDVKKGNLYYWSPRNGSVARFNAYVGGALLDCDRDPSGRDSWLGARVAKQHK